MLFNTAKVSALLLAAFAAASPYSLFGRNPEYLEMEVIAYRTCDKVEADNYEDQAKPVKPSFLYNKKDQTGEGIYTSPSPGEWPSNLYSDPRFCVIVAHPQAFKDHPKIWIPESQWDKPEEFIADWIRQQGLDPKTALRLSKIGTGTQGDRFQMMIPRWLTEDGHDSIGLYVECVDSADKLPIRDGINYAEWKNVKGQSQLPAGNTDKDKDTDKETDKESDSESDDD
ncbi:hypothetical protein F5X99DRAFT_157106 [Biscogniauxia marginata]|nr:hypothetical protein F5X99DRAFT_157106 [Biscogniauxia marginata]